MAQPELPRPDDKAPEGERSSSERLATRTKLGRGKSWVDLARRLAAPLVIVLVPLFWVIDATNRAAVTTLGRDQGIFQYIAWAVGLGDVDYRDIRDVNGPLVHLIHKIILGLGGADEHRFHVVELTATGISFAFVGYLLPGIVSRKRAPIVERLAWAAATWVVLSAQYHLYLYWNQAQRESFCDWFLLPSLALQIAAPGKRPKLRIVVIAALSTITWFGKPSFALFTFAQLAVLLFDRGDLKRRTIFGAFAIGAAIGAVPPLVYLFRYGDPIAFAKITFIDVPRIYRFIWAKSAQEILGDEGPLGVTSIGLAMSALVLALVAMRELPRRMIVLGLAPLCALVGVIAQHKGFGYHFHPLTATTHIAFLVVIVMLWERFRGAPRRKPLGRYIALAAAAALAFLMASGMRASPHTKNVWILAGGETAERRAEPEYLDSFKSYDFFPREMRAAASYLHDKTTPGARVQEYGMDPYLLFLADRRSATPYIYAYDLNDDAALEGGWSNRPTEAEAAVIRAARDTHERDMLSRLKIAPPEAFVFVDHAPLISYPDAWEDFRHCCAESATWVLATYHPAESYGPFHIWLRNDTPHSDRE